MLARGAYSTAAVVWLQYAGSTGSTRMGESFSPKTFLRRPRVMRTSTVCYARRFSFNVSLSRSLPTALNASS